MIGVLAFSVSIIAVIMSFFKNLGLSSFAISILAIIIATISAYYKDKKELANKEMKKDSRALEVGSIIIAGTAIVSYFVFLILKIA